MTAEVEQKYSILNKIAIIINILAYIKAVTIDIDVDFHLTLILNGPLNRMMMIMMTMTLKRRKVITIGKGKPPLNFFSEIHKCFLNCIPNVQSVPKYLLPHDCFVSLNELSFLKVFTPYFWRKCERSDLPLKELSLSWQGCRKPLWFFLKFQLYSWKTWTFTAFSVSLNCEFFSKFKSTGPSRFLFR